VRSRIKFLGKNQLGISSKEIASFLKLSNPERYTPHSFRRTSATIIANSEASIIQLKQHFGWQSDKVAMGYLQESTSTKEAAATALVGIGISQSSGSNTNVTKNITFTNCQNVTINF